MNSDQQNDGLSSSLAIDRATASRLGITPQFIDNILYDAFGQRQISIIFTQANQYRVVLEVDPVFRRNPGSLELVDLGGTGGGPIPLDALSRSTQSSGAVAINRIGQFPAATLSFNLAPKVSLGWAVRVVNDAVHRVGLPATVEASFQGTAQAFVALSPSEPLLILAALVTVYIVLGVLYESYVHPLTILSTLPSAGVGALLGLSFLGMELDVISLIGIVLLIGIVKKNAIMMVDFALEAQRGEGKSPRDAIYQASLLRFPPIMMTTMAALLGALPLAVSNGVGAELRRPLGVAIVGGLLVSRAAHALHDAGHLPLVRSALSPSWSGARGRWGLRMTISSTAIARPIATTLLTFGAALAGAIALRLLPVAALPQVEFPTIQVSAALPGASPETMATSVATPLERQFGRIAGITEMTSSSLLGSTSIILQFDLSRDIDGAARDVQAAINAARGFPAHDPAAATRSIARSTPRTRPF